MKIILQNNILIRAQTKPDTKSDIWLLHGLGESGLSFQEAFDYFKDKPYNLYAPDYPGFGTSLPRRDCQTIARLTELLQPTIKDISQGKDLHLVGHSMGGIVATQLCRLETLNTIKSITSIDGTIIVKPEVAKRLTGLSPMNAAQETITIFFEHAQSSPALMRYIASLNFCDPETLYHFARETYNYSGEDKAGQNYLDLIPPSLYIFGRQSWTEDTVSFLKSHDRQTVGANGGHWPMIDSPDTCYAAILNHIQGVSQ